MFIIVKLNNKKTDRMRNFSLEIKEEEFFNPWHESYFLTIVQAFLQQNDLYTFEKIWATDDIDDGSLIAVSEELDRFAMDYRRVLELYHEAIPLIENHITNERIEAILKELSTFKVIALAQKQEDLKVKQRLQEFKRNQKLGKYKDS